MLVDALNELLHMSMRPVRLILAGGVTSLEYLDTLRQHIDKLGLQNSVVLAGKVSDAELSALYRCADVFVCASQHEGFGMPLIEAMLFDVPVVALATSSVPDTMGEGGLLLESADAREMASVIHLLNTHPGLRQRVRQGQRRCIERFEPRHLQQQLQDYLVSLGIEIPTPLPALTEALAAPAWQVEGPFDSSYSLAIVNRELALALDGLHVNTRLLSTEGGGDYPPDAGWLNDHPQVARLINHQAHQTPAEASLRFCYPPRTSAMPGTTRLVHSYGWEETGFPQSFVRSFNARLDGLTVLSQNVKDNLRNSGIRHPMAVVGAGVDHLLRETPVPVTLEGAKAWRFLHVSSCFPRKAPDALLAAWGKAFRASDDVSLVIKSFPNPHNTVAAQLAKLRAADPEFPHVELIERDLSQAELVGLYQACHAFVAPSRGEGFGMPMAEAMMFGLPVITTAWGGQTDFCTGQTAWLVDYQFATAQSHLQTGHSAWADPEVKDLARQMRAVFDATPQQRAARTDAARAMVQERFTWKAVARRTVSAVKQLQAQPVWRDEPRVAWISSWNTRCGIAAYSNFLSASIPPSRLAVLADRGGELVGEEGINVVRCWQQSMDEDLHQALAQVLEFGATAVVIQYNFGFFSLATLGWLLTELAARGIRSHVFFHSTADLQRKGELIALRQIAAELARADRVYVHGIADLNHLKGIGVVNNVVYFPQGVPEPLPRAPRPADEVPAPRKRVLASYGFLLPHKGLQQLIEAFAIMAKADSSLHLLMLNALYPAPQSQDEYEACKALVERRGLGGRVTIATDYLPESECLRRLGEAEIVVYAYQNTQESSSAAVRMGLASGRAVAVTPLSIFDDLGDAVHRLGGVSPKEIAEGLSDLMGRTAERQALRERAHAWCEPRRWPWLSERLLNIIEGVANDPVVLAAESGPQGA
jgi:glycosyltransferase involved in cell wall biosynthesis